MWLEIGLTYVVPPKMFITELLIVKISNALPFGFHPFNIVYIKVPKNYKFRRRYLEICDSREDVREYDI